MASTQFMEMKSSSVPVRQRKTVSTLWVVRRDWNQAGSLTEPSSMLALDWARDGIADFSLEASEVGSTSLGAGLWDRSKGTSALPILPEAEVSRMVFGLDMFAAVLDTL